MNEGNDQMPKWNKVLICIAIIFIEFFDMIVRTKKKTETLSDDIFAYVIIGLMIVFIFIIVMSKQKKHEG